MNYQCAPFRMGISDVTPEELANIKKEAKMIVNKMYRSAVLIGLIAAEVSLRITANVLSDSSEVLKAASNQVADVHDDVAHELILIEEGEVLAIEVA